MAVVEGCLESDDGWITGRDQRDPSSVIARGLAESDHAHDQAL